MQMLKIASSHACLPVMFVASILALPVVADNKCGADVTVSLERAMFGVAYSAVPKGLLLGHVVEGGAAAEAGLQRGDLIVSVAGFAPVFPDNIEALVWADTVKAGQAIEMDIVRESEKFSVTLTGRPPTCREAQRISKRVAGGPALLGTEPCSSFMGGKCAALHLDDAEESEEKIVSDGLMRLLALAKEKGDLKLQVSGRAQAFRVEIVDPPGMVDRFSLRELPMQIRGMAEKLTDTDHAVFLVELFEPGDDRGSAERLSIRLHSAPDYAR